MQPAPPEIVIRLSPREQQIFTALAGGYTYPEIASTLGIREDTVRHYAQNARARLGARTMFQAAVTAENLGLLAVKDDA